MNKNILLFFLLALFTLQSQANVQQIATCKVSYGPQLGVDYISLYSNFSYTSKMNPNLRYARRDPSGQTYIQFPSPNPQIMYFINWSTEVVQVFSNGWRTIGRCNFINNPIHNPYGIHYKPMQHGSGHVRGIHDQYIPIEYSNTKNSFSAPLYASEQEARNCANSSYTKNQSIDRAKFGDCMLNEMLGDKERSLYNCAKKSENDETKLALCSLAVLGGRNEKEAVAQISSCYAKHQDNYDMYPLCMAQQNMSDDAANLLACIEKQSQQGDVSLYGTAFCYGGKAIDLTPEQQIALECAIGTGGEPYTFASCAGGRLTARELNKCLTIGVGGKGCFGPNNDIVKALNDIGVNISKGLGPNNTIVKAWNNAVNDLRNGPGKNNEIAKKISNAANDLKNGPGKNNDVVKALETIIPGFKW